MQHYGTKKEHPTEQKRTPKCLRWSFPSHRVRVGTSHESESASRLVVRCDSMICSPQAPSVHEIFQARILELVAIPFSRGSSWPRDWTHSLPSEPPNWYQKTIHISQVFKLGTEIDISNILKGSTERSVNKLPDQVLANYGSPAKFAGYLFL